MGVSLKIRDCEHAPVCKIQFILLQRGIGKVKWIELWGKERQGIIQ